MSKFRRLLARALGFLHQNQMELVSTKYRELSKENINFNASNKINDPVLKEKTNKFREEFGLAANYRENEKVTNYELEGTKITLVESLDTEETYKVMQMIVPAKGKNSAFQVFIIAGDLSKEETEKVMLSFLK